MVSNFNKPIPGQSLTTPPKSFPYERPPEITDPEEAIQMHLTRLSEEKMTKDMLDILELDVSVKQLTQGILRSAVAEGLHSIDVSLAIAPVIHEYIKTTADMAGVDYEEGLEDKEADKTKSKALAKARLLKKFEEVRNAPEFVKDAKIQKEETGVEEVVEGPAEEPTATRGFMQRKVK